MENQDKNTQPQGHGFSEDLFADMDSAPLVLEANSDLEQDGSLKSAQNKLLAVESQNDIDATPDLLSEANHETGPNQKTTSNGKIEIQHVNCASEAEKMETEYSDDLDNVHTVNQDLIDEDIVEDEIEEDEVEETVDELENDTELNTDECNSNEKNQLSKKSIIQDRSKLIQLPLGRIKNIMKLDPDANMMSKEAIFMVGKATELFIECLSKECMVQKDPKKKTIQKRDVDQVFASADSLMFLEGAIDF